MRPEDRLIVATNKLQAKERELQTALVNSRRLLGENGRLTKNLGEAIATLQDLKSELASLEKELKDAKAKSKSRAKPKRTKPDTEEDND